MVKNYSTFAVAKMLQVDPGSVANWVDNNILKAHRTPGGHRRVRTADLIDFLRKHKMPIPEQLEVPPVRILVVDDEPAVAKLIAANIVAAHPEFEVSQANDGFRAGMMISDLSPDVVILDIHMPGMDGFEVCKFIKAEKNSKKTDIIAITAHFSREGEEHILACGARVCLEKPLDFARLMNEISVTIPI